MKILNLFAGIGGNRKLWTGDITAVEIDLEIALIYQKYFPHDSIFIQDALIFVQEIDLEKYDFIWASPSCISHTMLQMTRGYNIPDLTSLYGLIMFFRFKLQNSNIKWVVENVRPWYKPLIQPSFSLDRHYYWSNFQVPFKKVLFENKWNNMSINQLCELLGYNKEDFDNTLHDRQLLRNCVYPETSKYILDSAFQDNATNK